MRIVQRIGAHSWRVVRDDQHAAVKRERDHYRAALESIADYDPSKDTSVVGAINRLVKLRRVAIEALSVSPGRREET